MMNLQDYDIAIKPTNIVWGGLGQCKLVAKARVNKDNKNECQD